MIIAIIVIEFCKIMQSYIKELRLLYLTCFSLECQKLPCIPLGLRVLRGRENGPQRTLRLRERSRALCLCKRRDETMSVREARQPEQNPRDSTANNRGSVRSYPIASFSINNLCCIYYYHVCCGYVITLFVIIINFGCLL